jgi:hypothetical protein
VYAIDVLISSGEGVVNFKKFIEWKEKNL